ncbi:trigger factor domain protein [Desulfitobacterium hafniense DCB-2]|uniref:Trigger factor C-terminal domain-containing protein n=2 Tax=Desulfitobacterium hafniense TaxID=49338 RepID=Q8RPH5_DESHA|nr:trigger factor [Desulfitobacterium hafniense]AAL87777.1 unknown [Desulfitobacterium hafniense DCB-2]ACL18763.1 trigger factor domain protein [Desulfitobacterium hafniense DCB-2]
MRQFELGPYTGLNVKKFNIAVEEDEFNGAMAYVRESLTETRIEKENDPVEPGDYVVVNIEGEENGIPIPSVKQKSFKFRVGDENVLGDFSSNLLGRKRGQTVTFDVVLKPVLLEFADLWGHRVTFTVEIVNVFALKEPELTDEVIRRIEPGVSTLQEFKEVLAAEITQEKKTRAQGANIDRVFQAIAGRCKYEFDPEVLNQAAENLYRQFAEELKTIHGVELINYLMYRKLSSDELLAECKQESARKILGEAIMDAVIQAEGFRIPAERLEKEQEKLAKNRQGDQEFDSVAALKKAETQLLRRKAMEFLLEQNLARE